MSAQSASILLNPNLVRLFALSVEVPVDDIKVAEASQKRVEKGRADAEHRKRRARDSYQCYLAYMKLRLEERDAENN